MTAKKLNMKLLIDKKADRVIFAEVGNDVVDFLFSLLSLPISSVIKLLNKNKMVGCLGNLYGSVENLNETYVLSNGNKNSLLNLKSAFPQIDFIVSGSDQALTTNGGFVKEVVTYMVMDDLVVTPMSVISSSSLLNKFNVNMGSLEEKVVDLGMEEGLEMLKASLESRMVLTHVFLRKKPSEDDTGVTDVKTE